MRLPLVYLLFLTLLPACGPREDGRQPIHFDRADPVARVRVERFDPSEDREYGVALPRLAGEFLVDHAATIVDLPYALALDLVAASGERVRVLVDHSGDVRLPAEKGEVVLLRYVRRAAARRTEWSLAIHDAGGGLRFLAVVRAPEAPLFEAERMLEADLRPVSTGERLYVETVRRESFCTTRLRHVVARLGGPQRPLLRPGGSLRVELPSGVYDVHLSDLFDVDEGNCEPPETALLSYEVVREEPAAP